MPFGGRVLTAPVPCTAPPGAFEVALGPPNPGLYMYMPPPTTKTYLNGPPLAPGQWVLGTVSITPATCVVGTVPTPVKLILSQGTSLPI
jgi:hypothetical protein